ASSHGERRRPRGTAHASRYHQQAMTQVFVRKRRRRRSWRTSPREGWVGVGAGAVPQLRIPCEQTFDRIVFFDEWRLDHDVAEILLNPDVALEQALDDAL